MVTGCYLFSNNSTAVLWTDRPEIAAYAELYNAETDGRKIQVVYKEVPWLALENETKHPDLVAGTRLDSILALGHFASLDKMIHKGRLDPSRFYSELFDMGCYGGKCCLVPISFTLPAVIFKAEIENTLSDDYIITYEEMQTLSRDFNLDEEQPTQIGYSPLWQPDFIYNLSLLFGANYSVLESGVPAWNDLKVQETVTYAYDWVDTTNGGHSREDIFASKYMHDPLYKLLDTERILFNFAMIDAYHSLPSEVKENLDFRWLSDGNKILVNDEVLFIGIPKQATQSKTAKEFISWLVSFETQVKLLESAQFNRMRFFGIAGGLSSLTAVNTDAIPRFFSFILGHIPHGGYLEFPNRLSASWERMRDEVIIPWFGRALSDVESNGNLADSFAQWKLRQPELYR